MSSFLDKSGLTHFWESIRNKFNHFSVASEEESNTYVFKSTDYTGTESAVTMKCPSLTQDSLDGHKLTYTPMLGDAVDITIPEAESFTLKLLWQNASLSSNFAAQTITVSVYDWYLLVWVYATTMNGRKVSRIVSKNWGGELEAHLAASSYTNRIRGYTTDGNGKFIFAAGTSNGSTANNVCIPCYIYGISGVTTK